MHQVSDTYQEILQTQYHADTALQIDAGGTLHILSDAELMARNDPQRPGNGPVYREDYIDTVTTSGAVFDGETPQVGACISRTIRISMIKPSQTIPRQGRIVPLARIANDSESSEWIPKGEFFIDTRQTEPGYEDGIEFLELTGYDAMMRAEQDYPDSNLQWPARDSDVLAEIAAFIGVPIEPGTLAGINQGYMIPKPEYLCCREVLSGIAMPYGGNMVIDDLGRLKLVKLAAQTARAMPINIGDNADDFRFGEQWQPITKVVLTSGDGEDQKTYTAGDDSGRTLEVTNPWGGQEMAQAILQNVAGYAHQPMSAENAVIDPAVELGDSITVAGMTGRMFSQELDFGEVRSSNIQAPGDREVDHEFQFKSKRERTVNRNMSMLGAGIAKAKEEANEKLYKFRQGLSTSIAFTDRPDGTLETALLETAVQSAIEESVPDPDNPGQMKKILTQAIMNLIVEKDKDGKYRSVAEILAEAQDAKAGLENKVTIDGDKKTASAIMQAAVDGSVAKIQASSFSDGNGNTKSMIDMVADLININRNFVFTEQQFTALRNAVFTGKVQIATKDGLIVYGDIYWPEQITLDFRNPGNSRKFLVVPK